MLVSGALLCLAATSFAAAQTTSDPLQATLYSPNKYKSEPKAMCLDVDSGPSQKRTAHCDLRYGNLWVGDDLDWFQSATSEGDRSVIKDFGRFDWAAKFQVPAVEPFPKLKPGERR